MSTPSEQEDADIQRAIKLSLQTEPEIIVLDSDDSTTDDKTSEVDGLPSVTTQEPQLAPITGMLSLDRKAMEQERLARKRKASISPPPFRKTTKLPDIELDKPTNSTNIETPPSIVHPTKVSTTLPYAGGAVKKTWALTHPRDDDIKFEEVLQKRDLTLAVLSSFHWDLDWLFGKVDVKNTQLIFVMQADTDEIKAQYRTETTDMPNLRLCFPSMEGQIKCMHSKLMLLSYSTHLRVVVPTANLVPYDWGETGIMENTVFLIDLPRLSIDTTTAAVHQMTNFGKELVYFLQAMGLEQSIIDSMHRFDFSTTKDLAFVHTIGGAHSSEDSWRRTGYCGLGHAVSDLGLRSHDSLKIDYVTSSVGSLNLDFVTMLYLAAQGDDGLTEYNWRRTAGSKKPKAGDRNKQAAQQAAEKLVSEAFRIYFPSFETVKASKGGPTNGGTICFQSRWWNSPTFPRGLLRDCKSQRKGMLMHNKILYVHPFSHSYAESDDLDSKSWAYIGSANCSESAWGRLVKDRQTKQPKLNCRNWECGVIVPLRTAMAIVGEGVSSTSTVEDVKGHVGKGNDETCGLKAFERLIPVPMEYPGQDYGDGKPWFYSE
ncbi:MAG: hypothetical protein Q9171_005686 [Xanthocarpia ochracea]